MNVTPLDTMAERIRELIGRHEYCQAAAEFALYCRFFDACSEFSQDQLQRELERVRELNALARACRAQHAIELAGLQRHRIYASGEPKRSAWDYQG